jgi:hypothetical protein
LSAPERGIAIETLSMTAMQLTCPDCSPRQVPGPSTVAIEQDDARASIVPAEKRATVATQFKPLDPGILNETIPAFFVGRNKEGFWVARDAHGQIGGIFLLENSALSFARRNSEPAGCATIFPSERFELDLENRGNPLAAHLGSLVHFVRRIAQQVTACIGQVTRRSSAG